MEFPSSDNNFPNVDDMNELIFDEPWIERVFFRKDVTVGREQRLSEGVSTMVHEESDKESIMKEDDTILNPKTESAMNNGGEIQMDPAACSVLTPGTSPQTVAPTPNIPSDSVSQPVVYAHNQSLIAASLQPANAPTAYVPGQRAPFNQLMETPNVDNFGTQRIQGVQATPTSSTFYEPLPVDIEEPVFGSPRGKYFPSLPLVRPGPSSVIIGQQPSSQCLDQIATIPAQEEPAQQEVIVQPSTSTGSSTSKKETQIPNGTLPICNICNRTYSTRGHLNRHLAKKHGDCLPFQCDICGEKFRTKQELNRHRKSHNLNNESYSQIGDIRLHFKMQNGKRTVTFGFGATEEKAKQLKDNENIRK